jgi:hypothetical protein
MIVFVAIFLLWLLVGLGCGLPGIPLYNHANNRMVKVQIIRYDINTSSAAGFTVVYTPQIQLKMK